MTKIFFVLLWVTLLPAFVVAQEKDSLVVRDTSGTIVADKKIDTLPAVKADTVVKRKHSPRTAAIRSAILPGLGQIYNKKYWKVPIVYTAIGIPVALFFDNKAWYDRTRFALHVLAGANPDPNPDSLAMVHPQLRSFVEAKSQGSLLNYRNKFRRDMDYSILFTLLFWGLNVVDATVDAHLKEFTVSEDLTLRIKPVLLPGNAAGISLAFSFGQNRTKAISSATQF